MPIRYVKLVRYSGLLFLMALEMVLAFSSIGFIMIAPVAITTLQIPVFLAAIFFGKFGGTVLGAVFGLTSIWNASLNPMYQANGIFSPFLSPDPVGSLIVSLGTRMLFGFCAGWLFAFLLRKLSVWPALLLGTIAAKFLHALLVYSAIGYFFPYFGLSAYNSLLDFTKLNSNITLLVSLAAVAGAYYFVYRTTWARNVFQAMENKTELRIRPFHFSRDIVFLIIMLSIGISLAWHMINRVNTFLHIYELETTAQMQHIILTLGVQLSLGMTALGIIIALVFFYNYTVQAYEIEKANRAKNDFISRISHDIRTPIGAISNMTTFAFEDIDDKQKLQDDLRKIESSNTFLLSLINDVLDISKIDSGKLELKPEPYRWKEYLSNIRNMFEPLCQSKGLDFQLQAEPIGEAFLVDQIRLNQVTLNILSNAVKYTPAGGKVTCAVACGKRADGRLDCTIRVSDTGIGMSEAFQKKMFEPFSQDLDNPHRKASIRGTGLGLAIVKKVVERMGGTINISSIVDKGTDITLCFIVKPVVAVAASTDPAQPSRKAGGLSGQVLLAEDNEINQEIAVRILEALGLTVTVVSDGKACVDRVTAEPDTYQLIFMDIQMPVMDGYEAAAAIRSSAIPTVQAIPIVAMTADAFSAAYDRCMAVGMNDMVTKPIDPAALRAVIKKYLNC